MKKFVLIALLCLAGALCAQGQTIYRCEYRNEAEVKVYVAKYRNEADLVVYRCKYRNEAEGNTGLWHFVKYRNEAQKRVYFVDYRNEADLIIWYAKYRNEAGWINKEKKQLMQSKDHEN